MISKILKAATVSTALLGSVAFVATAVAPDVVYAKNGNGGGNGGGSDNGKSASAKSGGGGKSATSNRSGGSILKDLFGSKSRSSKTKVKKVKKSKPATEEAVEPKAKGNPLAVALGVHPSELGALNAAHASPQALANASPNSRVGKLAIYAQEVGAIREIEADLAEAQAILDSMEEPTRSVEEIDGAITTAIDDKAALETQLETLQTQLAEAGGSDADIESEIEGVMGEIAAADSELESLQQERSDTEAYETASAEVDQLEADLEAQEGVTREALEAAANKEVTDEVELAVQTLLGIEPVEEVEPLLDEGDPLEETETAVSE